MDVNDPLQAALGIKLANLVAGIAGGVVRAFMVGNSWVAASSSAVTGALTAAYLTTPIANIYFKFWQLEPDQNIEHGIAFVVGLTAMLVCEGAIRYATQWSQKPSIPGLPPRPPTG